MVSPEGHGTFIKAVSLVDSQVYNNAGTFSAYDAVYLSNNGQLSGNLSNGAASTITADTVHPASGVTVKAAGDVIYLGYRLKPVKSYFWLDRLGTGGAIKWYYSSGNGAWKLINGAGDPHSGAILNGASYSMDIGNYYAPNQVGDEVPRNPNANVITWWDLSEGVPTDFARTTLSGTSGSHYYIKGVVVTPFATAPILNQTYERTLLQNIIMKKYGPTDYWSKWATATTDRLRSWGFNATGMYSYRYWQQSKMLADKLPNQDTWAVSMNAMRQDKPYHVKNILADLQCPPGSGSKFWPGITADMFEPSYTAAVKEMVDKGLDDLPAWPYAIIPEEADALFAFNAMNHAHMGYAVLAQNPYILRDEAKGYSYTDPKLYAKYAMRDYLRYRYRGSTETLAAVTVSSATPLYTYSSTPSGAELAALQRLNAAWGTSYTTWGTSRGSLATGTNAWGTGTGFMDENGKSVFRTGSTCASLHYANFTTQSAAMKKDLDDFVVHAVKRYGSILKDAFSGREHPPIFLPLYDAPEMVYRAIGPYFDGLWVKTGTDPLRLKNIYNLAKKPMIIADYRKASRDSAQSLRGTIQSVTYDAATNLTTIHVPGARYYFGALWYIGFPDAMPMRGGACGYLTEHPRLKSARWNTFTVSGNYARCVTPGMRIELGNTYQGPGGEPTQAGRAQVMTSDLDSKLNLTGDDGVYFIVGWEHWGYNETDVSNGAEVENFGLITALDNAFDGVEARRAAGRDAAGRAVGGEDADYGNLIGPLKTYLLGIGGRIEAGTGTGIF